MLWGPSSHIEQEKFTPFRCGQTSTRDAERSGRLTEAATPEAIPKIHQKFLVDRRLKVRQMMKP